MSVDAAISYINLAGILIAPIGFFFWVKFKIGQTDGSFLEMKMNHKEEIIRIKASKHAMKKELESRLKEYKDDQKEINGGLKQDIEGLRSEISSMKTEVLQAINNLKQ